jgi:hypothetical protein
MQVCNEEKKEGADPRILVGTVCNKEEREEQIMADMDTEETRQKIYLYE